MTEGWPERGPRRCAEEFEHRWGEGQAPEDGPREYSGILPEDRPWLFYF